MSNLDTRRDMMPESDPMRAQQLEPGPPSPAQPGYPHDEAGALDPELRMLSSGDRGPCPVCGKDGFLGATYCGNEDSYIECRKEAECDRYGRSTDDSTGCGSRWSLKILEQSVRVKHAALTAERDALRAELESRRLFPTAVLENNAKIEALRWVLSDWMDNGGGNVLNHSIRAEIARLTIASGQEQKPPGICSHSFEANYGLYDTSHRYCSKCGVAE